MSIFRYWVVNFPMHFSMDQKLAEVVSDFCTVLMSEGDRNLSDLINLSMVSVLFCFLGAELSLHSLC